MRFEVLLFRARGLDPRRFELSTGLAVRVFEAV